MLSYDVRFEVLMAVKIVLLFLLVMLCRLVVDNKSFRDNVSVILLCCDTVWIVDRYPEDGDSMIL
jgi:hypothetical protein